MRGGASAGALRRRTVGDRARRWRAARSAARPTARWSARSTRPAPRTPRPPSPPPTAPSTTAPGRHRRPASAATCCSGVADLLERDTADVARMESLDTGKRLVESEYDVADVVSVFRHYGRVAAEEAGRVVDTGNPDVVSRIVHEPVGVCGLITPWNYPLLQVVLEGRALPGRRQHVRAQAQRADAAHRDPPDAAARGGRPAGRGRQPRPRRRAGGRRAALRGPPRRPGVVHRRPGDRHAGSWPPPPAR